MKPGFEPLLFKPKVFYGLSAAGLVAGGLGLTPWAHYPDPLWWVGLTLAASCFVGAVVCWAIPSAKKVEP